MGHGRFQVAVSHTADPLARDNIVNVFYLGWTVNIEPTDWGQLATDAAELWATYRSYPNSINLCTVTAYDMADAKPREPKATETHAIAGIAETGPREVALCLSYYADRNLPRKRGRMYIGPWPQADCSQRPLSMSLLGQLASGISGLGGANIQWVQHSQTDGSFNTVTDWWVDNEWDTMRSRGLRAQNRLAGTVSG